MAGTAVDDRAGCAVLLEVTRHLQQTKTRPTVHIVFSVQEEFNRRGALTAGSRPRQRSIHRRTISCAS
ncbi:MAG: M28 family peptidase [Hyphomicrobiaceae bacterium]